MAVDLEQKLLGLKSCRVRVSENHSYVKDGQASVSVIFSDGTKLRADYWRLSKNGKALLSSFDHKQKYGLPAPIDAIACLKDELQNATVADVWHDTETGDLLFGFSNSANLQIINVTDYEIWQISFPDGTGESSNYAK